MRKSRALLLHIAVTTTLIFTVNGCDFKQPTISDSTDINKSVSSKPVSNTNNPSENFQTDKSQNEKDKIENELVTYSGRLRIGERESTILYYGKESGDLAGFCFINEKEACFVKERIIWKGEEDENTGKMPEMRSDVL